VTTTTSATTYSITSATNFAPASNSTNDSSASASDESTRVIAIAAAGGGAALLAGLLALVVLLRQRRNETNADARGSATIKPADGPRESLSNPIYGIGSPSPPYTATSAQGTAAADGSLSNPIYGVANTISGSESAQCSLDLPAETASTYAAVTSTGESAGAAAGSSVTVDVETYSSSSDVSGVLAETFMDLHPSLPGCTL
jgi:hypothetical protein